MNPFFVEFEWNFEFHIHVTFGIDNFVRYEISVKSFPCDINLFETIGIRRY